MHIVKVILALFNDPVKKYDLFEICRFHNNSSYLISSSCFARSSLEVIITIIGRRSENP